MAIPSWITVNPLTGSGNKTISITAQRNTEVSDRSFSLRVSTAGGVTKEITITQKSEYLAVSGKGILCKISILGAIFTQLGVTAITFGAYMEFTNGDTIECGTLTLTKGSAGNASTGYLKLTSDNSYIPSTRLKGVYIQAYEGQEAWVSGNEITNIKFDYSGDVAPFGLVGNAHNYLATLSTTKAGFDVDIPITTDCVVKYRGHTYGTFTITKQSDPARWSGVPQFAEAIKQQNVTYTSSQVTVYNVPTNGTLEAYCEITSINSEEPSPIPYIDATDSGDVGAKLVVHPLVTDGTNNSIKLEFRLIITDYSKFTSYVDVYANGAGTAESLYYGLMCLDFAVKGLDGDYVWSGDSNDITIYKNKPKLTLSPQSATVGLEEDAVYTLTYEGIIPSTLEFVSFHIPDEDGYVTLDWNPPTGNNDASGSFTFTVSCNSEAYSGNYPFIIRCRDSIFNPDDVNGHFIIN